MFREYVNGNRLWCHGSFILSILKLWGVHLHNNHKIAIDDCDKETLKGTLKKNLENSLSRIVFVLFIVPIIFSQYKISLSLIIYYSELKGGISEFSMVCHAMHWHKQSLLFFNFKLEQFIERVMKHLLRIQKDGP